MISYYTWKPSVHVRRGRGVKGTNELIPHCAIVPLVPNLTLLEGNLGGGGRASPFPFPFEFGLLVFDRGELGGDET